MDEHKCKICGHTTVFYKTGCDEFEAAIKKFGVDAALEYFATPPDDYHWFESLREETIDQLNQ